MRALTFLFFSSIFFFYLNSGAVTVNIDVNGYTGTYSVDGGSLVTGNQAFDLSVGAHYLGPLPGAVNFSVDSSGNVTIIPPISATASGNTLTLSTLVIEVDPQDYADSYYVYGYSPIFGIQNFTVIANCEHQIRNRNGGDSVNFMFDASGNLTFLSNPNNATATLSKLILGNVHLTVDPALYSGEYQFGNVNYTGEQEVVLLPGAVDRINVGLTGTLANITADYAGNVANIDRSNLILEPGKVTFKTVPVTFYPGYFRGGYTVLGYESTTYFQEHTFHLVPEAFARVSLRYHPDAIATFNVGDNGDVYWHTEDTILFQPNAIFFKNQNTHFAVPSGFNYIWVINMLHVWPEYEATDADLYLIPNKQFLLFTTTVDSFQLTGCVSDTNVSTGLGTFVLSCLPNNNQKLINANKDGFINIADRVEVQHINTKFSPDPNDFVMTNNGDAVGITSTNINNYLFAKSGFLAQGRNVIELSGEDENAVAFNNSYILWAGDGLVEVMTFADKVFLTVEQSIGGVKYTRTVEQQVVGSTATFENIPRIENGIVYVSTDRSSRKKVFFNKLTKRTQINL